eukprot:scaffold2143_cov154-Amphora_coffeaeformis.AAC.3
MMLSNISRQAATKVAGRRMMSAITGVRGREIIDSRGNPTVEVDITTSAGTFTASVPSGASTGIYEAVELRDGGSRYMGKGVTKAVANVNGALAEAVMGMDVADQRGIDDKIKAGAAAKGIPLWKHYAEIAGNPIPYTLPVPCFNVINGGEHAGNKLPFQEFFVIPTGAADFTESMIIGDEGGFAPPCDVESGLQMIMEATEAAGYLDKVSVGLDVASSEFKVKGKDAYDLDFKTSGPDKDTSAVLTGDEMIAFYKKLIDEYPIVTIEDPFDQDDWANWSKIVAAVGDKVQIVGDDLTVTNPIKIKQAVEEKAANCLLLKVNQIGSISESIDAVKLSKQNGWGVMTSHRSGETEDNYIADLAVGLCTGEIKTGAPCRGERTAKYNQLLRIEEELGSAAKYPGMDFRNPPWMG